ncbi:MAG: SMC-Scp complex subunit ScpB [Gammaproteobacteria bacterium]|nr:SMC-Scp complex subunit ScpB [Gammaproteobacteria bacterium]
MAADDIELKSIIEALLLASEQPLSVQKILSLFPDDAQPSRDDVMGAIEQLSEDCDGHGIELKRVGAGYRFQSRQKYAPWLRKLSEMRPPRYSRALLETLAIIAYRQPVTRGDIEEIRGVSVSSETIRTLLDREWIRQLGHRDVPGRPALYGTTKTFLDYFDLKSLTELPMLPERRDTMVIAQELNLTLPLEETEEVASDQGDDEAALIPAAPSLDQPELAAPAPSADMTEVASVAELGLEEVETKDARDTLVAAHAGPSIATGD